MLDFIKLPLEAVALGLPVSDEFLQKYAPVLAGILAQLIFTIIFERRLHEKFLFQVIVTVVALLAAVSMTAYILWYPVVLANGDVLAIFFLFMLAWGIFFHLLAYHFGHSLLNSVFGPGWVKGIDYLYLAGSFYGVYRLILGFTNRDTSIHNVWLPLMLAVALSLRFTKTSVEIFKWDLEPTRR